MLLKKGTKIVCKNHHHIATLLVDINSGDVIRHTKFEWYQAVGEACEQFRPCQICGDAWWRVFFKKNH